MVDVASLTYMVTAPSNCVKTTLWGGPFMSLRAMPELFVPNQVHYCN